MRFYSILIVSDAVNVVFGCRTYRDGNAVGSREAIIASRLLVSILHATSPEQAGMTELPNNELWTKVRLRCVAKCVPGL